MPDLSFRQPVQAQGSWSFILKALGSIWGTDEVSKQAAKRVLTELAIFYVLILVGFGLLYLTYRSNARLKEWRAQVQRTIAQQRGRAFEPQDAAKLYGMF